MDTTQTTPAPRPSVDALVFDAYGTLFDVQALTAQCEADWPGQGAAVSALWRGTQLEYAWLRSLMGRYADFERITADALAHACATLALPLSSTQTARLVDAYRRLPVFAEVPAALAALGARLIDHVAFTDPGPTLATLVTTPRWMLTGRRDAWLGLPPAGIDAATAAGLACISTSRASF